MIRRLFTLLILAAAVVFAWRALPNLLGAASLPPLEEPTAPREAEELPAPDGRSISICIDSSGSTDGSFSRSVKAALAQALEQYLPAKPADVRGGHPGTLSLDMQIRLVSARPLAYGQVYLHVEIPGVPELAPRPDMTAEGALDPDGPYDTWKGLRDQWSVAYDAAVEAGQVSFKDVAALDLGNPTGSGVRDCAAALTSVPPEYADSVIIIASDLQDNAFSGSDPDFGSSPMTLIQPCPSGKAKKCASSLKAFVSWAENHGAGSIETTRPESARAILRQLIGG